MSNEIAVTNESAAVLQVIERLVLNDSVSIEKIEKMLDLQERILNRNAQQAFTADLAAMQTELPLVNKKGVGHNNAKYALLEDINEAIRPALQKYGFAVTFKIAQSDKTVTIVARLSHRLGHSEETSIVLPLDVSGNKNATQAVGSTTSYGKRYTIGALLNISTGDDKDGAAEPSNAEKTISKSQQKVLTDLFNKLSSANQKIFNDWIGDIHDIPLPMFGEAQKWLYAALQTEGAVKNA